MSKHLGRLKSTQQLAALESHFRVTYNEGKARLTSIEKTQKHFTARK